MDNSFLVFVRTPTVASSRVESRRLYLRNNNNTLRNDNNANIGFAAYFQLFLFLAAALIRTEKECSSNSKYPSLETSAEYERFIVKAQAAAASSAVQLPHSPVVSSLLILFFFVLFERTSLHFSWREKTNASRILYTFASGINEASRERDERARPCCAYVY